MHLPPRFLDTGLWRQLGVDILYTAYENGEIRPQNLKRAEDVYYPATRIPAFIFSRVSDSEKRLELTLNARTVVDGAWGSLDEIVAGDAVIGLVLAVRSGVFVTAHVLPDIVHLVCAHAVIPPDAVMKGLHEFKTFRSFRLGPGTDDDGHHDIIVTAKTRWFRHRHNPKFLGFSKDDKL